MVEHFPDATWEPVLFPPGLHSAHYALSRIGRARYGDEWTGQEFQARALQPISALPDKQLRQRMHAARPSRDFLTGRQVREAPSAEQYEGEARAYARWGEVFGPIARWLYDNPKHALLFDADGRLFDVPRNIWASEAAEAFMRSRPARIAYDHPEKVERAGTLVLSTMLINIFEHASIRPPTARWSLLQALAWCCTRDRALVAEIATAKAHNMIWLQHRIDDGRAPQFSGIKNGVAWFDGSRGASELIQREEDSLLEALRADPLGARGLKEGRGDPIEMEAGDFHALRFVLSEIGDLELSPPLLSPAGATNWKRVTLSSVKVMARWPEPAPEPPADSLTRKAWLKRPRLEIHSIVALAHDRGGEEMPTQGTNELLRFRQLKDAVDSGLLRKTQPDGAASATSLIELRDLQRYTEIPEVRFAPEWKWLVDFLPSWLETASASGLALSDRDPDLDSQGDERSKTASVGNDLGDGEGNDFVKAGSRKDNPTLSNASVNVGSTRREDSAAGAAPFASDKTRGAARRGRLPGRYFARLFGLMLHEYKRGPGNLDGTETSLAATFFRKLRQEGIKDLPATDSTQRDAVAACRNAILRGETKPPSKISR